MDETNIPALVFSLEAEVISIGTDVGLTMVRPKHTENFRDHLQDVYHGLSCHDDWRESLTQIRRHQIRSSQRGHVSNALRS